MRELDPTAPDYQFVVDCGDVDVLWDPGANGYAIYNVTDVNVDRLKAIAKRYGMRASYYKASEALWIARKGATFDR